VTPSRRRLRALLRAALLSATFAGVAGGCGGTKPTVRDQGYIEILRLRITKVRNAIAETREAITQSQGAPYLPELYLRLAELLSEEAKYHYRVAYEREQRATESLHVPQVRLLKEQAIGIYKQILRRYPDAALADQALFNMAHEYRELGNFDEMRPALERLVRDYPKSPLRGEALLVLGDYHFDRSELDESRRYYEQITGGEASRVTALAHYKLGWVWVNLGNCNRALGQFETAIGKAQKAVEQEEAALAAARAAQEAAARGEGAQDEDDAEGGEAGSDDELEYGARAGLAMSAADEEDARFGMGETIDVRRSSLVDLVYCYTQERKIRRLLPWFRERAYDRPTYIAALERLAQRYGVTDNPEGSLLVVRELLRLGPMNERRLDDARQLHTSLRAQELYDRIGTDAALMARVVGETFVRQDQTDEARLLRVEEFEELLRDLMTRAQERIDKVRERDRAAYASQVADGYAVYLANFPDAGEYQPMLLNAADSYYVAGRYYEAGLRSLEAASRIQDDAERQDVLYDAVVRFQEALEPDSGADHLDRISARASLRRAAMALLRFPLDPEKLRRVKFAVAQSYYDDGHFREAIDKLTAVAYEFRGTEESTASMRLVLDSFNTLNDFQGLLAAANRFVADDGPADEAMRAEIRPIMAAAEQRMLDEVSLEAAGEEGGDLSVLVRFAERNEGTELGERALLNAFVAARATGDTESLYSLGEEMSRLYPESEQLPGMISTLGQMAVGRFEVEQALEFLSRASSSNHPQRIRLLVLAGELREQLGQYGEARQLYLEAARSPDPRARAEPLEKLARMLERQGRWDELQSELAPFADDGNLEINARLGLAQAAAGDAVNAETTLQSVISAGSSASPGALARAHYGMGEVLLKTLREYPSLDDPTFIEEYVTIVDVTQQSYLSAARQGSQEFTAPALARLSALNESAAQKLRGANLSMLPPEQQEAFRNAMQQRVAAYEQTAEEAVALCARQAWQNNIWDQTVRTCLQGRAPDAALPSFDTLEPRGAGERLDGEDDLRAQVARNPEDLESLRELGEKFLDAGDPHSARLVFQAALEREGGAVDQNLLGIAAHETGDEGAALKAFVLAAQGGLEAGRTNLVTLLEELGLQEAAATALEQLPEGRAGGRTL